MEFRWMALAGYLKILLPFFVIDDLLDHLSFLDG